ncbi:MAG: ABC transporter ATP-binding protein [Desulfuromonadales bacterium]|nr:ABC transporter ATP-binding protein [Desulfuromonadales bacterium]
MSDTVIKVENLSKSYLISHQSQERYTALRDVITNSAKSLAKRLTSPFTSNVSPLAATQEEFFALKDVSFEIKRGERVGIIGRNGAGKSTLLKILSRITEPTSGRVEITGRVASLLEVGTGFHPELTGRENIFLNGAILGMSRVDIKRKFDEIVAFAEVEKFLDTPVKRYSSGMYVRLAFAVAAHLEPEILIVDEVLAVGDAQFQKKCLGKMAEVGEEGRTVLFVSHNMQAIRNLCDGVIWLNDGQVCQIGPTLEVSENYLCQYLHARSLEEVQLAIDALPHDPIFRLEEVAIRQKGSLCTTVLNGHPVDVEIVYSVSQRTSGLRVYFDICDEERNLLIRTFNDDDADSMSTIEPGRYLSKATIPADLLAPRSYELRVYGTIYNVRSIPAGGIGIPLLVEKSNDINRAYPQDPIRSKLLPRIPWQTVPVKEEGIKAC